MPSTIIPALEVVVFYSRQRISISSQPTEKKFMDDAFPETPASHLCAQTPPGTQHQAVPTASWPTNARRAWWCASFCRCLLLRIAPLELFPSGGAHICLRYPWGGSGFICLFRNVILFYRLLYSYEAQIVLPTIHMHNVAQHMHSPDFTDWNAHAK